MNYYCKINGKESGPHDIQTLRSWLWSGVLHRTDPVRCDEEYGWSPASAFPELIDLKRDGGRPEALRPELPWQQEEARLRLFRMTFAGFFMVLATMGAIYGSDSLRIISLFVALYNGFVLLRLLLHK